MLQRNFGGVFMSCSELLHWASFSRLVAQVLFRLSTAGSRYLGSSLMQVEEPTDASWKSENSNRPKKVSRKIPKKYIYVCLRQISISRNS